MNEIEYGLAKWFNTHVVQEVLQSLWFLFVSITAYLSAIESAYLYNNGDGIAKGDWD